MPPDPGPEPAGSRPAVQAAVLLAGGRGSRLGGADKPALVVGGRTLLELAIAAVGSAQTVVVGPPRELPPRIAQTREDPPGGGPAAALTAGLAALGAVTGLVAVLAADLTGISAGVVEALAAALSAATEIDGAVAVDSDGQPQYLISVWRCGRLVEAAGGADSWHGRPLKHLLAPLSRIAVRLPAQLIADVDTPADLARSGASVPRGGPDR